MILLYCLATYRISSMLSSESGPFGIFDKFRYFIGVRYNEYSIPYGTNVVAKGVLCLWCNSVWVGILVTLSHLLIGQLYTTYICFPLSLSASAIIINSIVDGEK